MSYSNSDVRAFLKENLTIKLETGRGYLYVTLLLREDSSADFQDKDIIAKEKIDVNTIMAEYDWPEKMNYS